MTPSPFGEGWGEVKPWRLPNIGESINSYKNTFLTMPNILKLILLAIAAIFVVSVVVKMVKFAFGLAIIGGILYFGYRFFASNESSD